MATSDAGLAAAMVAIGACADMGATMGAVAIPASAAAMALAAASAMVTAAAPTAATWSTAVLSGPCHPAMSAATGSNGRCTYTTGSVGTTDSVVTTGRGGTNHRTGSGGTTTSAVHAGSRRRASFDLQLRRACGEGVVWGRDGQDVIEEECKRDYEGPGAMLIPLFISEM